MKAPVLGWALTGAGAMLGAGTSLAVAYTRPVERVHCERRFGGDRYRYEIHQREFPPSATCVDSDGRSFDYIAAGVTTTASILYVVAAGILLAGAVLLVLARLRRPPAPEVRGPFPAIAVLLGLFVIVVLACTGAAVWFILGPLAVGYLAVPALAGAATGIRHARPVTPQTRNGPPSH